MPARLFSTSSLVETLEPANTAFIGRAGLPSALPSASSSAASSGPAAATLASWPRRGSTLGAVGGTEGAIHYEHAGERGVLLRQLVSVLLALVEAHVP